MTRGNALMHLIEVMLNTMQIDEGYIAKNVKGGRVFLRQLRSGKAINMDVFLDIMAALKFDVLVVPQTGMKDFPQWLDIGALPYDDGTRVKPSDRLKRGHGKKK